MPKLFFITLLVLSLVHPGIPPSEAGDKFKNLLEQGIQSLKMAEHKKAVTYFRQAVATDPKNGDGYIQLAFGLQQLKKFKESLGAYESGLKLKPDYYYSAEAYYNMTIAADNLGNGVKAIKYLKKSLQAYTDRLDHGAVYKIANFLKELSKKYPELTDKEK